MFSELNGRSGFSIFCVWAFTELWLATQYFHPLCASRQFQSHVWFSLFRQLTFDSVQVILYFIDFPRPPFHQPPKHCTLRGASNILFLWVKCVSFWVLPAATVECPLFWYHMSIGFPFSKIYFCFPLSMFWSMGASIHYSTFSDILVWFGDQVGALSICFTKFTRSWFSSIK